MLLTTPDVDIGWEAIPFTLPDPDGREFRMDEVAGENGLLVAFICNHCPYVKAIADRLAADARLLQAEGFGVVAINSNDYRLVPDDSPPNMKRFAAVHDFSFPYLIDEDQSVGKAYGAVCTPDFFGFNRDGILQYRGRLDDAKMADSSNRNAELVAAMRLIGETGKGPTDQSASMGCSIKWRSD